MFAVLVFFALSKEISIDFGSYYTKSAKLEENGHYYVFQNLHSQRITHSAIAFRSDIGFLYDIADEITDEEIKMLNPIIGESALSIIESKPRSGITHIPIYIDLSENETIHMSRILHTHSPSNRFGLFNMITTYLYCYSSIIAIQESNITSTKFVIPYSYTLPQRDFLIDSAVSAGLPNVSLLTDVDAAAYHFIHEKADLFTSKDYSVLFIDIGATSTKVFTISFSTHFQYIISKHLSYEIDYSIGGSFFTSKLSNYIIEKLSLDNISYNEQRRLFVASEKAKKQLTLINETEVLIENINGKDFVINITRNEFDQLISQDIEKILLLIKNMSPISFSRIELLGGSSRIPIIQRAISQFMNNTKVYKSFNSDEFLTIGAAYSQKSEFSQKIKFFKVDSNYPLVLKTGDSVEQLCDLSLTCVSQVHIPSKNHNISLEYLFNSNSTRFLHTRFEFSFDGITLDREIRVSLSKNPVNVTMVQSCLGQSCKNITYTYYYSTKRTRFQDIIIQSYNSRKHRSRLINELEDLHISLQKNKDLLKSLIKNDYSNFESFNQTVSDFLLSNQNNAKDEEIAEMLKILKGYYLILQKDQLYSSTMEIAKEVIARTKEVIQNSKRAKNQDENIKSLKKLLELIVQKVDLLRPNAEYKESDCLEIKEIADSMHKICNEIPKNSKRQIKGIKKYIIVFIRVVASLIIRLLNIIFSIFRIFDGKREDL